MKLTLGVGGYVPNADELKKFAAAMPGIPKLETIKKEVITEQTEMKRGEGEVKPFEFEKDFAYAIEYSVSIWYKWTAIGRVAWENIYTLSYNEPKVRGNHARPGDRVLSMF